MQTKQHPLSLRRRISSGLLLLALSAGFFWSCQNTSSDDPPQGTQTYTAALPTLGSQEKRPDAIKWRLQKDSGSATFTNVELAYTANMTFAAPPADTVWVDLWKAGIRLMEVGFLYKGSTTLEYAHYYRLDPVVAEIFRRISPKLDVAAFDTALAKALVDSDTLMKGRDFPAKSPLGVDTADVMRIAMQLMVAKKLPLVAIVKNWSMAIDSAEVHVRVRALVVAKVITDTSILFPPYPVRATTALTIDSVLQAGEARGAVRGSFVATYQISGDSVRIFRETKDVTDSFDVFNTISTLAKPREVSLDGFLFVAARLTTAPGIYRLRVTVGDDSGRTASSSVPFRVGPPPDRTGPEITLESPATGSVLENAIDSIDVKVKAVDVSGVDSVWIDNRLASLVDGSWVIRKVFVPVTNVGFEISIKAVDRAGNPTVTSLRVGRKAPPTVGEPNKQVLQPLANQIFPFDSSSIRVRWLVIDPRGRIDSAFINGALASRESDTVWTSLVALSPTGAASVITLRAINLKQDEIWVSREVCGSHGNCRVEIQAA